MSTCSPKLDVLHRNAVRVAGSGPRSIVFAHGFGCDQHLWRFVAPAFEPDHRVVTFDYVGAGSSDAAAFDHERYSSLHGYAQDVLEICEALDLRDVVFVGHSVSSMIGLLAAKAAPGVFSHLVMVGPSARYIDDDGYVGGFSAEEIDGMLELMDRNIDDWAHFLAPVAMGNPDRPELTDELEANFCGVDPVIARQFARITFTGDNRGDLSGVETPTLVIQCAHDAIAPMSVGELIHHRLDDATMVVLDVAGHCPHVSHPAETVAAIRTFLRRPYVDAA